MSQDIIDSDFDEPEDDPEDPQQSEEHQPRRRTKRATKGKYVDPALKETRLSRQDDDDDSRNVPDERPAKRAKTASAPIDVTVDRSSLRKSTKAASAKADKERNEREAEQQQRLMEKRERDRNKVPERMPSQEELLAEAEETAKRNKADLEVLLRLEEERKRLPEKKQIDRGPTMTVISREGKTLIAFSDKETDARTVMFPYCDAFAHKARHASTTPHALPEKAGAQVKRELVEVDSIHASRTIG